MTQRTTIKIWYGIKSSWRPGSKQAIQACVSNIVVVPALFWAEVIAL